MKPDRKPKPKKKREPQPKYKKLNPEDQYRD